MYKSVLANHSLSCMTCVSVISNHMSQIIKSCNSTVITETLVTSGIPRNFFLGGGSTNSVDRGQRGWGSGGGSPLVRGSGGSCNLVQEI